MKDSIKLQRYVNVMYTAGSKRNQVGTSIRAYIVKTSMKLIIITAIGSERLTKGRKIERKDWVFFVPILAWTA